MKIHRFSAYTAVLAVLLSAGAAYAQSINNPLSAIPIEADGAYTGFNPSSGTRDAQWTGEWSDIQPAWFTSNGTTGATKVAPGTAGANSLLFAGLSRDTPTSQPELYLMYDYLGFTVGPTLNNEFLGSVSFPLTISGTSESATVSFQTVSNFTSLPGLTPTNFYTCTVSLNGGAPVAAASLGVEYGLFVGETPANSLWGVGPSSPFHTTPHELIELGVPLVITPQFVVDSGSHSPFTPTLPGDSGYSPDPAYWSSNITDNAGDPPASGGTFTINPNGSTFIVPSDNIPVPPPVPEPNTFVLVAAGAIGLWGLGRKRLGAQGKK